MQVMQVTEVIQIIQVTQVRLVIQVVPVKKGLQVMLAGQEDISIMKEIFLVQEKKKTEKKRRKIFEDGEYFPCRGEE